MCGVRLRVRRHRGDGRRPVRTCPLGDAWFAARTGDRPPVATVEGGDASLDEAVDAAAAILGRGARTARLRAEPDELRGAAPGGGACRGDRGRGRSADGGAAGRRTRRSARARRPSARSATAPSSWWCGGRTRWSPTRGCWSACGWSARLAGRGRWSSSTRSAPRPRTKPTRSSNWTRRTTSRRCGRCARWSRTRRSITTAPASCRSTTSRAACSARVISLCCTATNSTRCHCSRSSATSHATGTRSRSGCAATATGAAPRTCSPGRPGSRGR